MKRALPLSGWTLVSLRPQNQHAAVRHAARHWGARMIAASAFKLEPGPDHAGLQAALRCPIRIASSPNAVRFAARSVRLDGNWLAIGNGTAGALLRAGAHSVQIPEPQTADGLLQLPCLQGIDGRQIGLLTAPDGRGLLERELPARGARLLIAHTYRRRACTLAAATRQRIVDAGPETALLVSSLRAFQQFHGQFDAAALSTLKSRVCIASSVRLLEYLQTLGFTRILLCPSTTPQDALQTLANAMAPDRPHRSSR